MPGEDFSYILSLYAKLEGEEKSKRDSYVYLAEFTKKNLIKYSQYYKCYLNINVGSSHSIVENKQEILAQIRSNN